jgi:hypothetical protein
MYPTSSTPTEGLVESPAARVQRGPSEAARCASIGDSLAALPTVQQTVRGTARQECATSYNSQRGASPSWEAGLRRPPCPADHCRDCAAG